MSTESKVAFSAENETETESGSYPDPKQYGKETHQYTIAAVTWNILIWKYQREKITFKSLMINANAIVRYYIAVY